jgi:hypothetical protein
MTAMSASMASYKSASEIDIADLPELIANAHTGIHPRTWLANDVLNQFNEVAMMLDMLGDMPDEVETLRAWNARNYKEHFEASGFRDTALLIAAYENSPADIRSVFDHVLEVAGRITKFGLEAMISIHDTDPSSDLGAPASALAQAIRAYVAVLDGIIVDARGHSAQGDVDALFGAEPAPSAGSAQDDIDALFD